MKQTVRGEPAMRWRGGVPTPARAPDDPPLSIHTSTARTSGHREALLGEFRQDSESMDIGKRHRIRTVAP